MEGGGSLERPSSAMGTGEGLGDGGGVPCKDGVGEPSTAAFVTSSKGGSNLRAISSISFPCRLGDSKVELGGGSMTGVVQINGEAGAAWGPGAGKRPNVGEAADSFAVEGPMSFISKPAGSVGGPSESRTIAAGSSAPASSGSVTHGSLRNGVDGASCSLLACTSPPLLSGGMAVADKDEAGRPLGSFG